jgi:hypothetical protein
MIPDKEFYSNLSDRELIDLIQFSAAGIYTQKLTGQKLYGIGKLQNHIFKYLKDEIYLRGRTDDFIQGMREIKAYLDENFEAIYGKSQDMNDFLNSLN